MKPRTRTLYFFLIIITIALGLFSRSTFIPLLIYPYLGDALYAVMIYFIVTFIAPKTSFHKTSIISILICYTIEFSQLYQAPWISELRHYTLVKLVLGQGFLWTDLVSYLLGTILGFSIDFKLSYKQNLTAK